MFALLFTILQILHTKNIVPEQIHKSTVWDTYWALRLKSKADLQASDVIHSLM